MKGGTGPAAVRVFKIDTRGPLTWAPGKRVDVVTFIGREIAGKEGPACLQRSGSSASAEPVEMFWEDYPDTTDSGDVRIG